MVTTRYMTVKVIKVAIKKLLIKCHRDHTCQVAIKKYDIDCLVKYSVFHGNILLLLYLIYKHVNSFFYQMQADLYDLDVFPIFYA